MDLFWRDSAKNIPELWKNHANERQGFEKFNIECILRSGSVFGAATMHRAPCMIVRLDAKSLFFIK